MPFYKLAAAFLMAATSVGAAARHVCIDEMLKTERDPKVQSVCDALCKPEISVKDDYVNSVQKTSLIPEGFLDSEVAIPVYKLAYQAIKKSGTPMLSENDLRSTSTKFNDEQNKKYFELSKDRKESMARLAIVKSELAKLDKNEKKDSASFGKRQKFKLGFCS